MAEPAKRTKKAAKRPLSEEAKAKKRARDRARSSTMVNVGRAFTEWRDLRASEACQSDADLAVLLLQFYKCWQATTSTPHKGQSHRPPPPPGVSSVSEGSDRDKELSPSVHGVQPLVEEEAIGVLESSMHSLTLSVIQEEHNDSPDEEAGNDLRNTTIDIDNFWADPGHLGLEDGDSSDEDFTPSIHLKAIMDKTQGLQNMSLEEAVFDFVTADPLESESMTDHGKVATEDDLVGKSAHIAYNDNVLHLAQHLRLPIPKCSHIDNLTQVACPGVPPFQVILKPRGTGVVLEWVCSFGHSLWKWNSQPLLKFGMQGGDFMMSANILLSGNNYRKVALLFKFMSMGMVAESTFFRIQDSYCIEPVQEYWDKTRAEVIDRLREKDEVVVLGDGRMDSPGHCAQFCTYTTIEQDSRDIVHIVSVDKRETSRNSVIMEKECFVRTMDALLPEIKIKEVVTDAHPQISALLNPERGKYKAWHIQHSLDIWHAAKSLCKKLRRAGTVKQQTALQVWIRDIVNHFWYCSKQAATETEFKLMWIGVLHHVRNEHSWVNGRCQHEPLDEDGQDKPWIEPGSAAHQALTAIVLDRRWLTQVPKFINFRTTSDLENFQNHILMYASKRMAYTPFVYKTRTLLAAIDYNKHNRRSPVLDQKGHKMYKRSFNKKSKTWAVYTVKEKKQYAYIPEIQKAILGRRLRSGTGLPRKIDMRPDDPRQLGLVSSAQPALSTEELVRRHVSRGDLAPQNPQED